MEIQLPATCLDRKIPRLGLQMLVENAIKHTRISIEHPLKIQIIYLTEEHALQIRNNWQPRQGAELEGEGYGLNYLASIYRYYAMSGFRYGTESGFFSVYLPLSSS